ncbi:hypothetical protein N8K70_08760 [Microbacterium betulae]|uniref:Uncharacterized protein n=1 Tax=Microbacterium betulae TaxID=2981139 RepID=A0AA97FG51_9MICO|nr:hypothetical protein [Microbacterium sp. AB]WOF21489.1 hypothetical protein N8K70_08760 [Microbacterium sp. AB]
MGMEHVTDVSVGDWVRERVGDVRTIHRLVPGGFEAYARILHPGERDRPVGALWPDDDDRDAWEAFLAHPHRVEVEPVAWAEAAAALGRRLPPPHAWEALFEDMPRDAAGWRYSAPRTGSLAADLLTATAQALAPFSTASQLYAGVWDGWGGLLGHLGFAPSAAAQSWADPRHADMLAASAIDRFNPRSDKPTWQRGTLSDEISRAPRLELPERLHVLFRGATDDFAEVEWAERVPWTQGDPTWTPSPSILWPEDRTWFLATDVDLAYTLVGGSEASVSALLADTRLEARRAEPGASL